MTSKTQITEYGKFPDSFKSAKLSELCIDRIGVQTGPFGSQLHKEDYVEVGTPIITVEHLGDNRILHENTPFVSEEDKNRLSKYNLQEGDIVFSRVGSVDRRALVRAQEDGWLFSGRCLRVRANKTKIDPLYLSYFFGLEAFKKYIRSIAVGATMPSINTKILSDVPIYYPESLADQRKIALNFYNIDDKIELNRQTNQTLEHIAQAIFKSWFVDFEPTRAKIVAKENGQDPEQAAMCAISGIPFDDVVAATARLEQLGAEQLAQLKATATLFPDALVGSELGEIPAGWEILPLAEMIDFNPKRILKKGTLAPYLDMKNVPTQGHLADDVYLREMASGTKFINGDTLLARITPCLENGKTAFVDFLEEEQVGWGSTEYIIMRPRGGRPVSLGYIVARLDSFRSKAIQTMTGTSGRQRANAKALSEQLWINYPIDLLNSFDLVAGGYLAKAKEHGDESKSLEELRDTLLPKLLSGELSPQNPTPSPAKSDNLKPESHPREALH